ncbi:hypothetical protein PAXRUDRAFT_143558 [Paxillus rubicundulus Ve08.2h10]|uniref:Transmembrane protein n=1 Tax=Paxillus rubicundulus Ve08.2h10 TaxID=930991 RepID=A0A0D0DWC1_9AGAM|nr:hypothetical protein PAXRUDRAFT_143558 [Paxillus rubicundulus Ve08.2h10]
MRVLSFIPAFLLAAASFVAAAPTAPSGAPSCTSGTGSGNDAALQPIITIIANATAHIQPLSAQLSGLSGDSCTPDAVSGIVVQITAVVSTCVTQLQAAAEVDLTGLDLTSLCATIYGLLTLVFAVLQTVVAIVLFLAGGAVGTVQVVVTNLLNAVLALVGCLNIFVVASLSGVLGPVLALVCGVVDLLLGIVAGLSVLVGVN